MDIPLDVTKLRSLKCGDCASFDGRGKRPYCHLKKTIIRGVQKACAQVKVREEER